MNDRILVALDVDSRDKALALVKSLTKRVGMFKVGLQLYTAAGPPLVREIVEMGEKVFLDLKFHDIPNTVRGAAVEAAKLGVSMMTIHACGGRPMMEAAARALQDQFGDRRPMLIAVTVLTSVDSEALQEVGIGNSVEDQVTILARLARWNGVDGVVSSPREIQLIRRATGPQFKIVTPGIRLPGQPSDDQRRTATAREAIAAGADYIVVGRAVTNDPDPQGALDRLIQSL
jgi:orotidine-5'-phosphate decarboxylase